MSGTFVNNDGSVTANAASAPPMTQPDNLLAEARAAIEQLRKAEANAAFGGAGTAVRVKDAPYLIELMDGLKQRAEEAERQRDALFDECTMQEASILRQSDTMEKLRREWHALTQRNEQLTAALEAVDQAERSNCRGPDADKHQRAQWRGAMRKVRTALNEARPHG